MRGEKRSRRIESGAEEMLQLKKDVALAKTFFFVIGLRQ